METIRNYLEAMFRNLPNTMQVQKAKQELGQMMEDKYAQLKAEGKTDNEAVGIVISEFGNLDELAQDLGIDSFMQKGQSVEEGRNVSLQEAKDYIQSKSRSGFMIGIATLLCIISPCGVILLDGNAIGLLFLFTAIAIAVGIFVFSGVLMGRWDFLKQEKCYIDFGTADYIHNEKEGFRITNALLITVGVILCIVSVVPLIILSELDRGELWELYGTDIMLVLIAVGVLLFIVAGVRSTAYDTLLKLNDVSTVGGNFVSSQKGQVRYNNRVVAAIMSVYWPTVTCVYLCWSFLTYDWHITWIIWVIAALVENFIKALYRK